MKKFGEEPRRQCFQSFSILIFIPLLEKPFFGGGGKNMTGVVFQKIT